MAERLKLSREYFSKVEVERFKRFQNLYTYWYNINKITFPVMRKSMTLLEDIYQIATSISQIIYAKRFKNSTIILQKYNKPELIFKH